MQEAAVAAVVDTGVVVVAAEDKRSTSGAGIVVEFVPVAFPGLSQRPSEGPVLPERLHAATEVVEFAAVEAAEPLLLLLLGPLPTGLFAAVEVRVVVCTGTVVVVAVGRLVAVVVVGMNAFVPGRPFGEDDSIRPVAVVAVEERA